MMKKNDEIKKKKSSNYSDLDSVSKDLDKTKCIKKEVKRLRKLFSEIDENKKKLVYTTIDDVAFMTIAMEDLQERIVEDGTTIEYKNGENQYGTKQSPDVQIYLQMVQKKTQAMKILVDCLPKKEKVIEKDDGFEDFIIGRDAK